MLTANTNRIAWYIQRQQFLQFPRYSLAPRLGVLQRPKQVTEKFHDAASSHIRLTQEPAPQVLTRASTTLPASLVKPLRPLYGAADHPIARLSKTPTQTNVIRNVSNQSISYISPQRSVGHSSTVSYRPTHARQVSVPNSEVRWAPNLLPNILKPVWQERQAAVASTNNVSMKSIGQPELQLNMPLAPNARMDYGPAISPRLVAGPSQFDRGTMADSQANLPASAQPHDDGTRPSEVPSASTLHLDGSALGRWAIQHLERTLAKPTAGMTGIDPRASAPRSRVAPF